jgi:hypothetical protein
MELNIPIGSSDLIKIKQVKTFHKFGKSFLDGIKIKLY